jgi:hypothetical protein
LDAGTAGPPDEKRGAGPDLEHALAGTRARSYFDSLVQTLDVLLGAYREDRFSIVQRRRDQIATVRRAETKSH